MLESKIDSQPAREMPKITINCIDMDTKIEYIFQVTRRFNIKINSKTSIGALKELINRRIGYGNDHMELKYHGVVLAENTYTLSHYNVLNKYNILVIFILIL